MINQLCRVLRHVNAAAASELGSRWQRTCSQCGCGEGNGRGAAEGHIPCRGCKGKSISPPIPFSPPDEGLWDILIKDIPKEVTSYTFSMDILKQGVSYDFRVIAVNDYGYGTPSTPSPSVSGSHRGPPRGCCLLLLIPISRARKTLLGSPYPYQFAHPCQSLSDPLPCCAPAQKANPFYEEWWFLVVIALVGLIFILLLVFVLIIRGQSKKYAKKSDSGEHWGSAVLGWWQ